MKAAIFTRYGPPEVMQIAEVPQPELKDDEILVRVNAVNVFPGDCEMRRFQVHGFFWLPIRLLMGVIRPRRKRQVLGQEVSGTVEQLGSEASGFNIGDEVCTPTIFFGGYAGLARAKASVAIHKPANLSHVEAAGMSVGGLNALDFLRIGEVKEGTRLLLIGAGGCIGTMAVQVAKAWVAKVTAVDNTEKCRKLLEIGADSVVDFTREDYTEVEEPYDVIVDIVGRSSYGKNLDILRPGGFLILGNAPAAHMVRRVWSRFTTRHKVRIALAGYKQDDLDYLKELVESGKVKPVVDRSYALDEIVEAHTYVDSGKRFGNVVLTVS